MKIKSTPKGPVKGKQKDLAFILCKAKGLGQGVEVSEEQLSTINQFAHVALTSDQVYARRMLLAHNAIDRDDERFTDELLGDFASTLPGKALLIGHQWGPPGKGLFFEADVEEMSLEEAIKLTGEDLQLPEGVDKVKFLRAWFYTIKSPAKEELLTDIDGGIVRHVSIGFNATNLIKVTDEDTGDVLYWEYKGPGEALEGSLVWLGAQPGATITKGAKGADSVHIKEETSTEEENKKKEVNRMLDRIKALLKLGADATDDAIGKAITAMKVRLKFTESIVAAVGGDEVTIYEIKEMKSLAAAGKAYKKSLVEDLERYERMLDTGKTVDGDGDAPEKVKARKEVLMNREAEDLASDVSRMKALVFEKFPDEGRIDAGSSSEDQRDNAADGKQKRKSYRKTA